MAGSLGHFQHADQRDIFNMSLNSGTFAIDGTNTENVQTGAAINYVIDGVLYQKATVAEIDVSALTFLDALGNATTATAQAVTDDYVRIFLMVLNAAGDIKVVCGEQAPITDSLVYFPGCPSGHAPFAAVKVKNETGSDWIYGTTDLDVANATDTYYNLSFVPADGVAP